MMLSIRWDTVIIVVVIGLSVTYLIAPALLRIGAARLLPASRVVRIANAPERQVCHAGRRRRGVPPHLTLHHDGDADLVRRSSPRRQVS